MNAKQLGVWKEIVRQCKTNFFSSINVAPPVRSDAILAAAELVELVTPELANLLILLANVADLRWQDISTTEDVRDARALATRIREALEKETKCTS